MNPEKSPNETMRWTKYYESQKNREISGFIFEALKHVEHRGEAIDIGAGSLRDARFLLGEGFNVTALDKNLHLVKDSEDLEGKIGFENSSFEEFDFPENKYDFVLSQVSLFLIKPENFNAVFDKIKKSLKKGGILCISLMGKESTIAKVREGSTHTKEEIDELLSDMEIINMDEIQADEVLVSGFPANKHAFYIIAKKL